jgi:CBS domain containing-hemolysin-like protein
MVHIRDLIGVKENPEVKEIAQLKRDILVVPEQIPISHLVQKMRSQRTHMAIVADEFGGTAGLVTIEDLIEELVGEIYDEFDREEFHVIKVSDTEYEINGRVLLEEVSEILGVELDEEDVSTIGGYIFSRLGRKPKKGDEVEFDGFLFQVFEITGSRILKVKVVKKTLVDKNELKGENHFDERIGEPD